MLISKVNQFSAVNKANSNSHKSSPYVGMQKFSSVPDVVSFQGVNFSKLTKIFKKPVASTGKYPLNVKDLILRLNKNELRYRISKAVGNHVWVNEYRLNNPNEIRESLFADRGKRLLQIHTNHEITSPDKFYTTLRKESVYMYDDGTTPKYINKYNKDGRQTKRIDYREDGSVKEVTNYNLDRGIKNWVNFKEDGKTVASIKKPMHEGGDETLG